MPYNPKEHHRRSTRWFGYDYTQAGAYFVTACVQGHTCLFGEIIDGEMRLNDAGRMVQAAWNQLPDHYPVVETDAFVVTPNHVHGIIRLAFDPAIRGPDPNGRPDACRKPDPTVWAGPRACPNETGQPRGVAPTSGGRPLSLGDVVHRFKTLTTKRYADGVKQQGWSPFPGRLWQRNYYEHVIRSEASLSRIRQYITTNPISWTADNENPQAKPQW